MNLLNTRKYPLKIQYLFSIGAVLVTAFLCYYATHFIGYRVVALVLLMTVSFIAMLFEILPVLTAAVLSAFIWNFFFIPPTFTFHIGNTEDLLMFLLYFFIAMLNAVLTFKIREAEKKSRDKEEKEKTIKLYNTLLNSLSHELKTPISTIIGAVDTLKENRKKLSDNHQTELLNEMEKASLRLNRQVENLLSISRLESGIYKPNMDWFDLNELLFSVINENKEDAKEHRIQFNPKEDMPLFKTDRDFVELIIHNIIHNALQHTPKNSLIAIEAKSLDDSLEIIITDNGKGFPENEIINVFNKFYRLSNASTGGTGLGLSIAKGFTEALNGKIHLENVNTGGAKFIVIIPSEVSSLNQLKHE